MLDHVGQQLGSYRLTRLLGKGGFANVYLAEHIYLKSYVAVKVLFASLNDKEQKDGTGGAIWNNNGTLTLIDNTVSGNIAKGNIARGGGIYSTGGKITLENTTVDHNTAIGSQSSSGGGIAAYLYQPSQGQPIETILPYRKAEKKLARLQRSLSRKQKKSAKRKKARKALAKQHLKVQRQREDFARKVANTYVTSSDLIA